MNVVSEHGRLIANFYAPGSHRAVKVPARRVDASTVAITVPRRLLGGLRAVAWRVRTFEGDTSPSARPDDIAPDRGMVVSTLT